MPKAMLSDKKQEAISNLVSKGLKVIPLKSNSKLPTLRDWLNRGSSDMKQVAEWASQFPNCNFGVLTGDGIVVLDVDCKNGKDGYQVLSMLDEIPNTFTVKTPNGGLHYYFKISMEIPSRNYGCLLYTSRCV